MMEELALAIVPGLLLTVSLGVPSCGDSGTSGKNAGDAPAEPDDSQRAEYLSGVMAKLRPLHRPLGRPGPHDWLAHHREPGQTFREYLDCRPTLPRGQRRVLYIQPLGEFTRTQRRIIGLTAEFMGHYFNLPVKTKEDLPLSLIPASARRTHPQWGVKQILTSHVLEQVLRPRLPEDAACYLAFTASDLWPGEGWNFVFGQASLVQRVGIWSIYRNSDPDRGEAAFRLCLRRTLKTATHETGHMFSMLHCTKYECNMCGSNHREESDRRPLALCPECLAKVCWAARTEPAERYRKLAAFCQKQGLQEEAAFYDKSLRALSGQ